MLTPRTEKDKRLLIKNVVDAVKDIEKLNKRGYDFLYLASGFIAHYNISGFIDHYRANSLKDAILRNEAGNRWDNFREGEQNYEYYHQEGEIYKAICNAIRNLGNIPLKACFCDKCGSRLS